MVSRNIYTITSETSISFKKIQGHSHDGVNSTLIDTTKYSLFDFIPALSTQSLDSQRQRYRNNNINIMKKFIIDTVEERVLNPAGIAIQANTITSREIVSGTITADLLSANLILVNNIIKSNNYIANSTGWIISYDGTAEFSDVKVRGTVVSNSGTIGGWTIDSNSIYSGTKANSGDYSGVGNITIANTYISSNQFTIAADGVSTFKGTLSAPSGNIGGWIINPSNITSTGSDVVTLYSNGQFSVGSNANNKATITSTGDFYAVGSSGTHSDTQLGLGNVRFYGPFYNVKKGNSSSANEVNLQMTFRDIAFYKSNNSGYTIYIAGGNDYLSNGSRVGTTFIDVGGTGVTNDGSISCTGWFRSTGASGWFNQTYSGGFYMTDSTWIRSWLNKSIITGGEIRAGYFSYTDTTTSGSSDVLVRDSTTGRIYIKSSLRELKDNITSLSNSLDIINKLKPRSFSWKLTPEQEEDQNEVLTKRTYKTSGFILDEVLDVSPELVTWRTDENGSLHPGYWKTDDFVAIAIQGIKELNKKVNDLEEKLKKYEDNQ